MPRIRFAHSRAGNVGIEHHYWLSPSIASSTRWARLVSQQDSEQRWHSTSRGPRRRPGLGAAPARRRRRGWRRRPRTPAVPLVQSSHTEAARRAGRTGSLSVSNVCQRARLPGADESRVDDGRRRGAAAGRRSGGYSARVRSGQRPSGRGVASRGQQSSPARASGSRQVACWAWAGLKNVEVKKNLTLGMACAIPRHNRPSAPARTVKLALSQTVIGTASCTTMSEVFELYLLVKCLCPFRGST